MIKALRQVVLHPPKNGAVVRLGVSLTTPYYNHQYKHNAYQPAVNTTFIVQRHFWWGKPPLEGDEETIDEKDEKRDASDGDGSSGGSGNGDGDDATTKGIQAVY